MDREGELDLKDIDSFIEEIIKHTESGALTWEKQSQHGQWGIWLKGIGSIHVVETSSFVNVMPLDSMAINSRSKELVEVLQKKFPLFRPSIGDVLNRFLEHIESKE